MAKKLIRLQPFCNFYSQYSPTKSTLTVRRLNYTGGTIKKWTVYVSNEKFEQIMSETDDRYRDGSACLNSFEPFLKWISCSATPRPG
ncbi:hypothetical protein LCGC14_0564260, partial [marine sediment metagenome]